MKRKLIFVAEYNKFENDWMERELEKYNRDYTFLYDENYNIADYTKKYGRLIYWKKYIKLANRAIKESDSNDVIIGLTFTVGLIISVLSKLKFKKRNVLSLNLISYDNSKLDFIKKPLFRWAFLKNNLISTVNAIEYRDKFNEKFNLKNKNVFYILNDPYNERFINNEEYDLVSKPYCFAGGEANRDWNVIINSAKICNEIDFKIIARKKVWKTKENIPCNLTVKFDKASQEFIRDLKNSEIVLVTLKDNMVSGLTVFIQAIAMKKFVLVSNIPATKIYVPEGCEDILVNIGDSNELSNKIKYYFEKKDKRKFIVEKLYEYLIKNFSKEKYVKRIIDIVDKNFGEFD